MLNPERVSRSFADEGKKVSSVSASERTRTEVKTQRDGLGWRDGRKSKDVSVLHVLREELEPGKPREFVSSGASAKKRRYDSRPVGRLEEQSIRRGHDGRDDVDALSDAGDADLLALSDEDVEPGGDPQHVSVVVRLLESRRSRRLDFVPDVPFADRPRTDARSSVFSREYVQRHETHS